MLWTEPSSQQPVVEKALIPSVTSIGQVGESGAVVGFVVKGLCVSVCDLPYREGPVLASRH